MGKRDELIEQYADDLKNKCGQASDNSEHHKVRANEQPADIGKACTKSVGRTEPRRGQYAWPWRGEDEQTGEQEVDHWNA